MDDIWSNEKRAPCCLGCIGDDILPSDMRIISHYKGPYKPTSIMESNKRFLFVAHLSNEKITGGPLLFHGKSWLVQRDPGSWFMK